MGELESSARDIVKTNPERPAWRAGLGTLLLREAGGPSEARAELDALAANRLH